MTLSDVRGARAAIMGVADGTPLVPSPFLSGVAGAEVLLKLESMQPMGAFKLRGALNAIRALPGGAPGVVCCSTGNHGRAVAWAARAQGLRAVVCLSTLVPEAKVSGIRALGAELRIVGRSQDDAQEEASRLSAAGGLVEIPPFDDPAVIAGQGTIALELIEARPDLRTLLVPLSGGGLAAGIAVAVKAIDPSIRVIGLTMDRGAAMHAALRAGRPVPVEEVASLADSLGGGIGLANRHTFALCRELLDEVVLVGEDEIYRGMQALYWEDRLVAEGACAVGVAALLSGRLAGLAAPIATIVTGRNVDMGVFTRVVTGQDVTLGAHLVRGRAWDTTSAS
ncbi:hydroxyectoine utilization dehydratase EutB [Rhodovulum sp. 12E13]|uniref:hydroxyectoine utilization dehydratase EutB n=1 Tax=Rhodovulum sp. 12E13 TaxID=2203891 RepID=UPI0021084BD7|nr:hydroxyectoine utilization dehydratase EutB [Rhodovulum sp. 12E13]